MKPVTANQRFYWAGRSLVWVITSIVASIVKPSYPSRHLGAPSVPDEHSHFTLFRLFRDVRGESLSKRRTCPRS